MSPPPKAPHDALNGTPDTPHGCLPLSVQASFLRGWPSDGDVVPADFGVVWAMAGVDWRIEIDLDGTPLDPGPITTGPWQSFELTTSLAPGSEHTLARRIFEGDTLLFDDSLSFAVGATASEPPSAPVVIGVSMVEDFPSPCGWDAVVGSTCEADLQRYGCANPIESYPSYELAKDGATLLHVVTSQGGSSEVSWAACPALREVVAWDCPEDACVTITAVGDDGRLGPSVEHCDTADSWRREDAGESSTGDDAATSGETVSNDVTGGCAMTADHGTTPLLLGMALAVILGTPRRRRATAHP